MSLQMQNITFVHPGMLWLLVALPLLVVWYYRTYKRRYPVLKLSNLAALQHTRSLRGRLRSLLPTLRILAMGLLIIALARPQQTLKEEQIKAEGIDIALVMDLSSSMLAQDFKPDRLEVSKRVAADFINKRPYDRIALSVFSGEAFTQCPLTTDHAIVKNFLAELQCGLLEDGTAIGMGLATSVNRLKDSDAKSKVIILLTDGVNNAGYIKPLTAAEIAKEFNIKVYTIGVGSTGEALTPVSRRSDGKYIYGLARVEIDEALLTTIATSTGGQYFRATSEESLAAIYDEIDQLEKTEMEVTSIKRYSEEFRAFAWLGLLLILLELLLRYTVLRAIP
jgi:Ca-activated chloride channel family protein